MKKKIKVKKSSHSKVQPKRVAAKRLAGKRSAVKPKAKTTVTIHPSGRATEVSAERARIYRQQKRTT